MKHLSPNRVQALIQILRRPVDVGVDQKARTKTYATLRDFGYCTLSPYERDYRVSRYHDGVTVAITRAGIQAIREFGTPDQVHQLAEYQASLIPSTRQQLAKLEQQAQECRDFLALHDPETEA